MRLRSMIVCVLLVASAGLPARASEPPLRVLLANVGNSNVWCQPYAFKLCFAAVEERVAARIQALQPDIVGLIEVLPLARCASAYGGLPEPDPQKLCSPAQMHELPHQVQRLVGPGYSIACDARFAWDCIAARDGRVSIDACATGASCFAVHGLETAAALDGCDPGFTVTAARVTASPAGAFRVVLAHPDSGFGSGSAGVACRTQQLGQAFAFAGDDRALLIGDFNMDPYRSSGPDVDAWHAMVGDGRRFAYHSGLAEHDPPHPTFFAGESSNLVNSGERLPTIEDPGSGAFPRTTIDHVASDFLDGVCETLRGEERLDGGAGGGMDHRALVCDLT